MQTDSSDLHDDARVLIVDDDRAMAEMIADSLRTRGYDAGWQTDAETTLQAVRQHSYDLVITDLRLQGESGLQLCERIVASRPGVPVVLMTAFGTMDAAIAAIRAGAYDFINKPIDLQQLNLIVERAIRERRLQQEVRELRETVARIRPATELIGDSAAMMKVQQNIEQIAPSDATVLITGESGTGKELVARAIHKASGRTGRMVAVNCAALPATLLESELFGHVRGAFTDAKVSREGLFVQADGGTLHLDEIGEMPLEMQAKLLRVLQERSVRPIGGDREIQFNTRIVTATNRDIDTAVEEGRFREDLFYRINVVRIAVPALRSRGNDILALAQHFLSEFARRTDKPVRGISAAAAQKLLAYDWPGNVRELENGIERAVAMTRFEDIVVDDLPQRIATHQCQRIVIDGDDPEQMPTLEEVEGRYIRRVLTAVGGNKTQAARVLGLDRRTLYRRLDRLEIEL
jgi:DNA-binding NtrC family response regulator